MATGNVVPRARCPDLVTEVESFDAVSAVFAAMASDDHPKRKVKIPLTHKNLLDMVPPQKKQYFINVEACWPSVIPLKDLKNQQKEVIYVP